MCASTGIQCRLLQVSSPLFSMLVMLLQGTPTKLQQPIAMWTKSTKAPVSQAYYRRSSQSGSLSLQLSARSPPQVQPGLPSLKFASANPKQSSHLPRYTLGRSQPARGSRKGSRLLKQQDKRSRTGRLYSDRHSRHSRHSWCLQRLKKQEVQLTASSKHQSTGGNDVYTEELVYRRGSG